MEFKNILNITLFLFLVTTAIAQVGIDKLNVDGSALLEFGGEARGIRLMPVNDISNLTASAGTIAFDGATGSFRYYNGTTWSVAVTGGCTSCGVSTDTDASTTGVIIGAASSSAQGVLILGADSGETKGLVLPNVNFVETAIPNPPIGLMVYDTASKSVKVFNGTIWNSF